MAPKRNAALEAMIVEATVDAYNDDEQLTGLFTMLEEHLVVPFATMALGVEVTVKKVDLIGDSIVAICAEAATGSGSTCSSCNYPPHHRAVQHGSMPTGTGQDGRPRGCIPAGSGAARHQAASVPRDGHSGRKNEGRREFCQLSHG
ncbi:calcium-binding protein [Paractinoplanes ovalisporus]|uniref:calcium-binding protein n=1 Tax=Paractinoplanes ovalisporus TaxID=2810368 RepID=UPI001F448884|nr:calcium-binding protein [Actinoplanes ovalisporus]